MAAEYHLIDLAYGISHGGFRSLEAARQYARDEDLIAWDIFRGNVRVEYHDPRADQSPGAAGLHSFAPSLCCCSGPISSNPLLASLLRAFVYRDSLNIQTQIPTYLDQRPAPNTRH